MRECAEKLIATDSTIKQLPISIEIESFDTINEMVPKTSNKYIELIKNLTTGFIV